MGKLAMTIGIGLLSLTAGAAPACELRSSAAPLQRIELYTSEGCSSCPPADRWFSELAPGEHRLLLAFHVDYWDDLGWPDRFADARYSQRQRMSAERQSSRSVYTPAILVDGKEYRGWRAALPAVDLRTAPEMLVSITLGERVEARLHGAAALATDQRAYLAITEDGLYTEVRAGENRGKRLRHDHVVRAYAGPLAVDQVLTARLPAGLDRSQARLAIWVEDAQGHTIQALNQPLAACVASDTPN